MAKDTNCITIIGRLGRDAELKYTNSGMAVCGFSLASNGYKDSTLWLDVKYWGKGGEAITQYLTKGKQVCVTGELAIDEWEKDGQKKSKTVVNANSVQLLGGHSDGKQEAPKMASPDPANNQKSANDSEPRQNDFADDIPF